MAKVLENKAFRTVSVLFIALLAAVLALFLVTPGFVRAAETLETEDEGENLPTPIESLSQKIKALNQEKARLQRDHIKEKEAIGRKLNGILIESLRTWNRADREALQRERTALIEERDRMTAAFVAAVKSLNDRTKELIGEYIETIQK